jgi:RHS repeat-associated protein
MDSETGLYYLRARYYDPNIGRFISEDSYWGEDENPLSLNLYTYCENDPIRYSDPTGHQTVTLVDSLVGAIFDVDSSEADSWLHSGCRIYEEGDIFFGNVDNYSNTNVVINVLAGSNTTITNHESYNIETINTGDNSNTTIKNMSIIDTINTGKSSSLVLNNYGRVNDIVSIDENGTAQIFNYEGGYIKNIKGGDIDSKDLGIGMDIFDFGDIDYVFTGKNSTNLIINPKPIGNLIPGDNNSTNYTGVINAVVDNITSKVEKNGKLTEEQIKKLESILNPTNVKNLAEKKLTDSYIIVLVAALNASDKVEVTLNSNNKYEVKNKGTGKSDYKFSLNGEELLKQIELPSSENYNGKSYYVYDNDGKLIGIRCQDVGDGGVTIGYGSYTSWSDTQKLKNLKAKYGITSGMSAKELFNIVVPIDDCIEMMREETNSKTEKLINNVIKPNGIKLTQQQFDALLIHRYMVGSFDDGLEDYLKDNSGNYKRDELRGVMLDYLKGLKSWNKYGKGWTKRIDNEMNIFFNGDYRKTF